MPGARRSDADGVARGRELVARRAWVEAHATPRRGRPQRRARGSDLDLLAEAAYMLARDDEYLGVLANFDRVLAVKERVDPDNVFRSNRNVRRPLRTAVPA